MHVEDVIAVVGYEPFTPYRPPTHCRQLPTDKAAGHRHDFDRQGKASEHLDQLGIVNDAHEASRSGCNDLFSRQRATSTLDQMTMGGRFVGPSDIQLEGTYVIEIEHLDAGRPEASGRGF